MPNDASRDAQAAYARTEVPGRLHAKGLIGDPSVRAKLVVLTEAGPAESKRVFAAPFARDRSEADWRRDAGWMREEIF